MPLKPVIMPTTLTLQVMDQTTLAGGPEPGVLISYLNTLVLDLYFLQKNGAKIAFNALRVAGPLLQARVQLPANFNLTNNVSLHIKLSHNAAISRHKALMPNVLAWNDQLIFPSDSLTLTAEAWQSASVIKLCCLPPPFLFNFRQDLYAKNGLLTGADLSLYQSMQAYFKPDENSLAAFVYDALTPEETSFFKQMGNNATLFIHGYNVGFGAWPAGTDPDLDLSRASSLPHEQDYGTDAHCWLLAMEDHLNRAAGLTGKDYSKFSRIIGISWQGDPINSADYMAAMPMAAFAAQKVFGLIQALHQADVKVNLIAHSLGNHVLMQTLALCAKAGIQVEHTVLWQAAIPNSCFMDQATYPQALSGAVRHSILFSDSDTILGEIPQDESVWGVLKATATDPGAGLTYSGIAGTVKLANSLTQTSGIRPPLQSIYHLANLFVEPLSYFANASAQDLSNYYAKWRTRYPSYQTEAGKDQAFPPDLATQHAAMTQAHPLLFAAIRDVFLIADNNPPAILASYTDLSHKQKVVAGMLDSLQCLPLPGANTLAGAAEHAAEVATLMLSVLSTAAAIVPPALGYTGVPDEHLPTVLQSPQKAPNGQNLCIDHSAMLFPTLDFMTYVYKGVLLQNKTGLSLTRLGVWPPNGA